MKILSLIVGMVVATSLLLPISFAEDAKLPPQVHSLFNWYSNGQISYDTFKNILAILVENDIFQITQIKDEKESKEPSKSYGLREKIYTVDNSTSLKFFGLIPVDRTDRYIIDEKKRDYYFKFQYENELEEERVNYHPWILENVKIKTDKGYTWKYKNDNFKEVPIEFCPNQMDPRGKYQSDQYRISINKYETPKSVHMTINGEDYVFNVEFVSPWDWKHKIDNFEDCEDED